MLVVLNYVKNDASIIYASTGGRSSRLERKQTINSWKRHVNDM